MISPWSTNPKTTENMKYVFRACFLDDFQGEVMAKFARDNLKAKTAAVLYDVASEYNKGIAEFFKKSFEKLGARWWPSNPTPRTTRTFLPSSPRSRPSTRMCSFFPITTTRCPSRPNRPGAWGSPAPLSAPTPGGAANS